MDFFKEQKQRKWDTDINSYYRWKAIYDKYDSELAKERMEIIKQRWPNHAKAFE